MYRSMRRIALVSACVSLLLLAGCGKKTVEDTAPLSFAPADTPYLYANFEPLPDDVAKAWRNRADALRPFSAQSYQRMADVLRTGSPELADELQAVGAELQSDKSAQQLVQHTGLSPKAHIALYGIGIVPVLRFELSDPQAFRAFIARVEKRVGHPFKTAELDGQKYWVNGYGSDKLNFLLAIEGNQAVATLAPADADPALLKQLLGLTKPEHSAASRLSDIDGAQGYTEYGSGYLDLPKLLARLSDAKDPVTLAYAEALGAPAPSSDPSCPAEFASIGAQMPLASIGYQQFEADRVRGSLDVSLSAPLRGMLANLKQPVPGMAATSDGSLFDLVLALPLQKVQAFWLARAQAVAAQPYKCPTLASLNEGFKSMATSLQQQQLPPQVASLLGFRAVLDQLVLGSSPAAPTQVAARLQVASSDPNALLQLAQKNLPQLSITAVKADGKPIALTLPPQLQSLTGGASQGWIAADTHSIGIAIGAGEDTKLASMLAADAGDGSALMRIHFDGKLYGAFADFSDSLVKKMPPAMQPQLQQQGEMMRLYAKWLRSVDAKVTLDDDGLHVQGEATLAQ